ncbi:MAG: RDD family protein [Gammaproteobacteria bacterium]|nr:RDD family protein [Gammaproteobacteria bacterium]
MAYKQEPASLFKRLVAIGYDGLLLIAVLFIATALTLPLNGGVAITNQHPYFPFLVIYWFLVSFIFYGWFWTHGGQTLGMKTWKLELISTDHKKITWNQAFIRFCCAIFSTLLFGLGFLWSLFNEKKATLHDILSNTMLVDNN